MQSIARASANTQSTFVNDGLADPLATPANQTTNSETWTGTGGFTNAQEFQLNVTVTVNRVGPVIARVHLGEASKTVYVDPIIVIS